MLVGSKVVGPAVGPTVGDSVLSVGEILGAIVVVVGISDGKLEGNSLGT